MMCVKLLRILSNDVAEATALFCVIFHFEKSRVVEENLTICAIFTLKVRVEWDIDRARIKKVARLQVTFAVHRSRALVCQKRRFRVFKRLKVGLKLVCQFVDLVSLALPVRHVASP